jgi:hypothetical protein
VQAGLSRLVAWLALAATASCAGYVPHAGRHVVVDSSNVYHRDGREYPIGLMGGGADALVAGDARALEHVARHQHLVREGTFFYALGLAGMIVGAVASGQVASPARRDTVLWGSFGAGAAITAAGIYMMLEGKAALVDAINVYNDDVDAAAGSVGP